MYADLSFSPDGTRLVTASEDGLGRIWDIEERCGSSSSSRGTRDRLTSAKFSPDGKLVVTASADHDAMVWNAKTGKLLEEGLLRGHGAIVSDAGFSSDGRWIVTAGPGRAALWEVRTGKLLTFLDGHFRAIRAAEFDEWRLHGLHGR